MIAKYKYTLRVFAPPVDVDPTDKWGDSSIAEGIPISCKIRLVFEPNT